MNIRSKQADPKPTQVYDTFWKFAFERQEVFFRRYAGEPAPWTQDPIIGLHKFTNPYRACDRTSQYLIKNVLYKYASSAQDTFFRCILFKLFNRISTWELLESEFGDITSNTYLPTKYAAVLDRTMLRGDRIFSAAYIMPSRCEQFRERTKHRNFLALLAKMLRDETAKRLTELPSMAAAFDLLRGYPFLGDFLAYQFITDLNYSTLTNFSEMEFVMPGPGARDGIKKCFSSLGDLTESDVIRYVADNQEKEFCDRSLKFRSLWGRRLQLIDCQNLFCEVSKYARIAHPEIQGASDRKRIKQKFVPKTERIAYWFPPKWGINRAVAASAAPMLQRRTSASFQTELF